jgi:hypothetical protein
VGLKLLKYNINNNVVAFLLSIYKTTNLCFFGYVCSEECLRVEKLYNVKIFCLTTLLHCRPYFNESEQKFQIFQSFVDNKKSTRHPNQKFLHFALTSTRGCYLEEMLSQHQSTVSSFVFLFNFSPLSQSEVEIHESSSFSLE